jgi:hypothetical protein
MLCHSTGSSYSTALETSDSWIAAHTLAGVAGMARCSVPIASVMALMTAGGAAIAPASPHHLMPSGFEGHLVTVTSTFICGKTSARGIV